MDFPAWGAFFTSLPMAIDWIIIGVFVVIIAADAMRSGSARSAAIALSLPAALLLVQELPKAFLVGSLAAQMSAPWAEVGIFAVAIIIMFSLAHRIIFAFSDGSGPVQALAAGLAAASVLIVIWLQVPALDSIWHWGDQVQAVFAEAYRFWWLLGSYLALAALHS